MRYHFKIHREKDGFWAECLELEGCLTEADSKDEIFQNMKEALDLYLEEPGDSSVFHPFPDESIKTSRNIVEVQVDPAISLAMAIRQERIKSGFTQKEMAKRLEMNQLYSYQRLERKCNPSFAMIVKLAREFPSLSLDRLIR